jgi:CheY-like chemotaxis protein/DNA-directed RNA polymerase specialized sigma24 family protein
MSDLIHRQLPYLRRFARALVGRQGSGDRLVAQAFDRLDGSLAAFDDARQLRLALLQALVDSLGERGAGGRDPDGLSEGATIANERIVATRVRSLPENGAVALLLATLEGLPVQDIAFVMRLETAAAEARLRAAQAVLDAQDPCTVLIIEDEPVIAMDIAAIVRQAGHLVLGIASTRAEAVAMAARGRPGLVLADIALADNSSGIKAVDDIRRLDPIPAIFITAFPERLLDDERIEPSLLISKPFSEHLLRVAIAQALELDGPPADRHAGAAD